MNTGTEQPKSCSVFTCMTGRENGKIFVNKWQQLLVIYEQNHYNITEIETRGGLLCPKSDVIGKSLVM